MTICEVPPEGEFFELAVQTRDGCAKHLGTSAESAVALLGVAAFQLQAARVGVRMAAMANDGTYTQALRAVATDYGGVSGAALNLSVRCSVTAVDLCGAALGRLSGLKQKATHECDAQDILKAYNDATPTGSLSPLVVPYLRRLRSSEWSNTESLRHQLTHKLYRRGIYGSTQQPTQPTPLAFPQQIDLEWGEAGMVPLDVLSRRVVDFAEDTFREFCANLSALA